MKIISRNMKLIIIGIIIILFVKSCYELIHIDVKVIRYVNEKNQGFEGVDLQKNTHLGVAYLGSWPALVDHIGMNISEKLLSSIQTNISLDNIKNEYSLPFIDIINCHVVLKNESGKVIPFRSIEFGSISKPNTFLTEKDFTRGQFIKQKLQPYHIRYLYKGDLRELQNATIEIDLTLSLDGEIVKIHRKEKLRRTERIDTKWRPFT